MKKPFSLKRLLVAAYISSIACLPQLSFAESNTVPQGALDSAAASTSNALPSVASINLCADQLIMLFAQPSQILSISNLSHEVGGSYFYDKALNYPVNDGGSEQILALKPDFVIAGEYSAPYTLKLLRELGVRVEVIPIANSLEQVYSNILNVSSWLGHKAEGEAMVATLKDSVLRLLGRAATFKGIKPTAAFYGANGYTAGANSLRGQLLSMSGWDNVATQNGIEFFGTLTLESLIQLAPNALISSPYSADTYSRSQKVAEHPSIRASGLNPIIIDVPSSQTICEGPWTVDLVESLINERDRFVQQRDGYPKNRDGIFQQREIQ